MLIKVGIIFLSLIFIKSVSAEELFNVVVRVKNKADKQRVIDLVKSEKLEVKAKGEKFLLVSPRVSSKTMSKIEWDSIQDKIRNTKNVISVVPDKMLVPKCSFSTPKEECGTASSEYNIPSALGIKNVVDALNKTNQCTLSEQCNGQSLSWAPLLIGADLAEKIVDQEVSKSSIANPRSQTAVVDTGFDVAKQESGLLSSLRVEKGHELAGDKNVDDGGHGTPVSGMVSGKYTGVTKNTDLTVYKITQGREGNVSNAQIAEAVEKACKENNDVVNLSWGSLKDEEEELEPKNELWYEVAQKMGCLIVKAAGNSGIRHKKGSFKVKITDPIISVEALDSFEDPAVFSTTGMIAAPGAGVFSLLSTDHFYGDKIDKNICKKNGNSYGAINGTSFSAPAAAGVATQIVTVLRARGVLPSEPSAKIKMIKSIMIASQAFPKQRNGINAYAALLIAQNVNKDQIQFSPEEFVKIAQKAATSICNEKENSCDNRELCENKISCVQTLRKKSFVCELTSAQKENLIKTLNDLNEKKLVMSWIGRLSEKELMGNPTYKNIYSKKYFEEMLKNADEDEKAFLLSKSAFKKNPEWKSWVQNYLEQETSSSGIRRILTDSDVEKLPEWETWAVQFFKNLSKKDKELFLQHENVRKLPDWNLWVEQNYKDLNYEDYKINYLINPVIQKHPKWKDFAEDYFKKATDDDSRIKLLKQPEIIANENWEGFVNTFWESKPLSDSSKITFLKDSEIQKTSLWATLASSVLEKSEKEVPRLGYLMRDENVQKLPNWSIYAEKYMVSSNNDVQKALLLKEPNAQALPKWNEWVNSFMSTAKDESAKVQFLTDPNIQKLHDWEIWAKEYISTAKDEFQITTFLKNPRVQKLPEWLDELKKFYEQSASSYTKLSLICDSEIQKHPIWNIMVKNYGELERVKGGDDFYGSFLIKESVQTMPEWTEWANKYFETAKDNFSMVQLLKDSNVQKNVNWTSWMQKYMEKSKDNSSKTEFLEDPAILRNENWNTFAKTFIEKSDSEDAVVSFLRNQYVKKKPEWKDLVRKYLEASKNGNAKTTLLEDDDAKKLVQ